VSHNTGGLGRVGPPAVRGRLLIAATAAAFGLAAATLATFPLVSPYLADDLHLTYTQVGGIAAAYFITSALFQIPAGLLGTRLGSRRCLLWAIGVMSVFGAAGAIAPDYRSWLVTRALAGAGSAAVLPLSVHLLTHSLTGSRLVKGLGVFVSGWGIGTTVVLAAGALVLSVVGWRSLLLGVAALGIFVFAIVWRALGPDNPGAGGDIRSGLLDGLRSLFQIQSRIEFNLMGSINAAGTSVLVSVPGWLPLHLTRSFGLPPVEAAGPLAATGLAVIIGGWTGGLLAARFGWYPVVAGSLIVAAALTACVPLLTTPEEFIVVAFAITWLVMLFSAPMQSILPVLAPDRWTAIAAGYYNTLGWCGAFLATAVFGILVDSLGRFTIGWFWLAVLPLLGSGAAFLLRGRLSGAEAIS
jgi:predicted MFS family arabinose efflux permease